MTRMLLNRGFKVTGVDRDEKILERLRKLFQGDNRFTAANADLAVADLASLPGAPFQTALCLNLLKHQ